ncbi:MAG: class B sortase [Bacilli bacterium]|nr:class B sortase [Bacilli bacterium]
MENTSINKKRKKRRIRWNNVILLMFILIFLTILIISSIKIIDWIKDSKSSEKEITNIQENTEVIEIENNQQTEIIETFEDENEIPKTSPYWTYIEMNLIDVDFAELKRKNSDTAGWIQVNGTNINYPYVQTNNNEYYLTHSFEKKKNSSGWVFMDYRNNKYDFDKNTIIYAHGRMNNTMFGTLRKILKNGWLNNTNNHVIKLSTETENTLWQVFSVYKIPTTNDYIQVNFVNDIDFVNFGEMLTARSNYNFNTTISAEDKILTLSTCYDDNVKIVLHAKLIKREKK